MGKSSDLTAVFVRLPAATIKRLDAYTKLRVKAGQAGFTRSEAIRLLLFQALGASAEEKAP
jgi:hypothetical protein